ncbi:MAG: hypothetical protein ACI91F_001078, partial [Candidatus Binatia bacterium]
FIANGHSHSQEVSTNLRRFFRNKSKVHASSTTAEPRWGQRQLQRQL